jgi:hypothetical protein
MAAVLPVGSKVGHGRDTYVKVGSNDWRRDVGDGYVSGGMIYDRQMAGTTVREVGPA